MPSPNETSVCELPGGKVMLNLRHRGMCRRRAVTASANGQTAWEPVRTDTGLPDPACYAGLLRVGNRLLFSNCASETSRINLTIRVSDDFGSTWPCFAVLDKEAGYSDLAASPDGKIIYCFYERGNFQNAPLSLQFASFSLDSIVECHHFVITV
jgi:sialidase-1